MSLQGSNIDIVFAIKQILKATSALKSLESQDPLQWPMVKQVVDQIKSDANGEKIYQGTVLMGYIDAAIDRCKQEAVSDLKRLTANILSRLQWSDMKLLRALLVFIETQSWMKKASTESCDLEVESEFDDPSLTEVKIAIEQGFLSFIDPLEARGVSLSSLLDDIEDAIDYARRYLALESTNYRKVSYSLHICPDSHKWPNILLLCELAFSLPFSNARVEQIFSIKTNNRTRLNTSTLDDLLEIFVEGPPFKDFSADSDLELWWKHSCTSRRPNQGPRKVYRPRYASSNVGNLSTSTSDSVTSDTEGQDSIALDDWDELFLED